MEVARAGRGLDPVGAEGHRPEGLPADVDQQVAADQAGRGDADHHDGDQGRQQASGPAQPELRQVDPAAAGDLAQQQGGDQEAGEHEEDVDPEEAAGQHGRGEVEDQDADDRERADAVQPVDVTRPGVHLGRSPAPAARQHGCRVTERRPLAGDRALQQTGAGPDGGSRIVRRSGVVPRGGGAGGLESVGLGRHRRLLSQLDTPTGPNLGAGAPSVWRHAGDSRNLLWPVVPV